MSENKRRGVNLGKIQYGDMEFNISRYALRPIYLILPFPSEKQKQKQKQNIFFCNWYQVSLQNSVINDVFF